MKSIPNKTSLLERKNGEKGDINSLGRDWQTNPLSVLTFTPNLFENQGNSQFEGDIQNANTNDLESYTISPPTNFFRSRNCTRPRCSKQKNKQI